MRVGFFWSGRRDTWINQHKSVPFDVMLDLVRRNPQYQWVNLQVDATEEETSHLMAAGVESYPGTIRNLADTAGLLYHMDVVVGIDSAVSHLAGAMGRPTWIMLNNYATDWRWLLNRNDSPWYKTVRLFRQEKRDEWRPVAVKIEKWLDLNKI
jgi:ADP-heptose:LPS heptosyltransferase